MTTPLTDNELRRWLDAGLIDLLISISLFARNNAQASHDYDIARDFEFFERTRDATALGLLTNNYWPQNEDPGSLIRRAWQLGYIEEASRSKAALDLVLQSNNLPPLDLR